MWSLCHPVRWRLLLLCIGSLALPTQAQTAAPTNSPQPVLTHPLGGTAASTAKPPPRETGKRAEPNAKDKNKFKEIPWDDLIPANWNPLKEFQGMNLGILNDGDPRATALLNRMREVWDQAPINDKMDGALIRIPGYVVPLEDSKEGMKEFLLVPYFGACIHSPPPPANQIIHVLPNQPVRGLRSMDAVWIQGPIKAFRHDSFMGVSGYRMQAQGVELFVEKADKTTR
ncbi:MAG: DUF3299 domain-containing protein [Rhizobacter sp.]